MLSMHGFCTMIKSEIWLFKWSLQDLGNAVINLIWPQGKVDLCSICLATMISPVHYLRYMRYKRNSSSLLNIVGHKKNKPSRTSYFLESIFEIMIYLTDCATIDHRNRLVNWIFSVKTSKFLINIMEVFTLLFVIT